MIHLSVSAKKDIKFLMIACVFLMVGMVFSADANAQSLTNGRVNPVYLRYLEDMRNGNGERWNVVPDLFVPDFEVEVGYGGIANLPETYNLVEDGVATQIKNQGTDGICWAYAITTAMESNLLKTQRKVANFSAKQLDYLIAPGTDYYDYIKGIDVLIETGSGSVRIGDIFEHALGDGISNFGFASFGLSSSSVPAEDSAFFAKMKTNDTGLQLYDSYGEFEDNNTIDMFISGISGSGDETFKPYSVPMSNELITGTKSDYMVKSYTQYYAEAITIDDIKEAVYNGGAVYVQSYAPGTDRCYDSATNTVVDMGVDVCGTEAHAMAVVGWDDNHAYTNPDTGLQETGAFILQNSWGNSDLLLDYGITYERLVEDGVIDHDGLSQEQIQRIRNAISNYNAYEFVYLAYDFEASPDNGGIIGFASIEMGDGEYDYVYDVTDMVDGFGDTGEQSGVVYTFDTGETKEQVKAVSFDVHFITLPLDMPVSIYLDNGSGYKKFGSVSVPKDMLSIRRTIVADKPTNVNGTYKVKLVLGDGVDLSGYESLFTVTAYADTAPLDGDDEDGGDGGDEGDDGKDEEEDEVDIKVPNTGWFVGGINGGIVTISLAMLGLGVAYIIYRAYAGRKEIFHRVKFDKK